MRVIAGQFKGRRLVAPKGSIARPTTDKVKEALFGAIQFDIDGAQVLDAFAGSGALGIEALSRGAVHADFIEKNATCIKALKENLENIVQGASYDVYRGDAQTIIGKLKQYDIVFLDPPYDEGIYEKILIKAHENGILTKGCKIIMECRRKFDFLLPTEYNFIKKKDYGDISLWFLEYKGLV